MKMTKGMDEGPVYCSHEIRIFWNQIIKLDLEQKLTSLCIKNLKNDLNNILNNKNYSRGAK